MPQALLKLQKPVDFVLIFHQYFSEQCVIGLKSEPFGRTRVGTLLVQFKCQAGFLAVSNRLYNISLL